MLIVSFFFLVQHSYALTPRYSSDAGSAFSLQGKLATSNGNAHYTVSINVLPGRADYTPELVLSYNSDIGNSLLGMGWEIQGLSAITRCGKNGVKDSGWGGVNVDNDDNYCLDGQRLVAIRGVAGNNLTEYRTEKNGYSKIISFGQSGNGPTYFKMWTTSGNVFEYGANANARAELPGSDRIFKWAKNKQTDISGKNHISYVYNEDSTLGSHRISQISYVGGAVVFNYLAQDRLDKISAYLAGKELHNNKRLESIIIQNSGGIEVGRYALTYQQSLSTKRSLLNTIAYVAEGKASAPIHFDWQSINVPAYTDERIDFYRPGFIDRNRDGQFRLYALGSETSITHDKYSHCATFDPHHTNGGSTTHHSGGMTLKETLESLNVNTWLPRLKAGFFNDKADYSLSGDRPYLNAQADDQLIASCRITSNDESEGSDNLNGRPTLRSILSSGSEIIVDINNDGLDDVVEINGGWISYKITELNANFINLYKLGNSSYLPQFIDINNDGYKDLIFVAMDLHSPNQDKLLSIHLFDGQKFIQPAQYGQYAVLTNFQEGGSFADINNDGYPDLYMGGKVYRNNFGVIDLTDEIYVNSSYKKGERTYFKDINGDGWLDFVTAYYKDNKYTGSSVIKRSSNAVQDKIQAISEYANHYQINYKPLVDKAVHTQEMYDNYPVINTTPAKYVVAQLLETPKGYATITRNYHYWGAKSHVKGGRFLGFRQIREIEKSDMNTESVWQYEQMDLHKTGQLKNYTVKKNNKLVSTQALQYKVIDKQGVDAKYVQVYANIVTNKSYQLSGEIEKTVVSKISQDKFANTLKQSQHITALGSPSYVSSTSNTYLSVGVNKSYSELETKEGAASFDTIPHSYAGIGQYCADNGDIYLKPNDNILAVANRKNEPIILKRYNHYYKLSDNSSSSPIEGVKTTTGTLETITKASFDAAITHRCGTVYHHNIDDDDQIELASQEYTHAKIVNESGNKYWQLSALKQQIKRMENITTGELLSKHKAFSYHADSGLLATIRDNGGRYTGGSEGKYKQSRFAYDSYGNVTTHTLSGSHIGLRHNSVHYDDNGLYPVRLINTLGHATDVKYAINSGKIEYSIDANKRKHEWLYDGFWRLQKETKPGNNVTTYRYHNSTPNRAVLSVTATKNVGQQTNTYYDYAGREVRNMKQSFNGKWVYRDTDWDRHGRKLRTSHPSFSENNNTAVVHFKYDERDREIEKKEPGANGGIATYTTNYSGLTTTLKDARNFMHSSTINAMGYITHQREGNGYITQSYQYYPDGKLKNVMDKAGNITHTTYDNLGFRSSVNDPNIGLWRYDYNAVGELISQTDANGINSTFTYDNLGRKTDQVEDGHRVTWAYDNRAIGLLSTHQGYGNRTDYYYKGGLLTEVAMKVADETFSTRYSYDSFERISTEVRPKDSRNENLQLIYQYNKNGYLNAILSPRTTSDSAFASEVYREEVKKRMQDGLTLAKKYVLKADRYQQQQLLFSQKMTERNQKKSAIQLDKINHSSAVPLGYKGFNVGMRQDVKNQVAHSLPTQGAHDHSVNFSRIKSKQVKRNVFNSDLKYVNKADRDTQTESRFTKQDLQQAMSIAFSRYHYYTDLSVQLVALVNQVGELTETFCEKTEHIKDNESHNRESDRCPLNDNARVPNFPPYEEGQTLHEHSTLAALHHAAYITYWQRHAADADDHTVEESLGNRLVNTYVYNQNTEHPSYIATHKGNPLFSNKISANLEQGKNIRLLSYQYDNHDNVISRYDSELGIRDNFYYDGLDRLTKNTIVLDASNMHGVSNPDLISRFDTSYDRLGNIKNKTGIGRYRYETNGAGPYAVSRANGLEYFYDNVGNMRFALMPVLGATQQSTERQVIWSAFNKPLQIYRSKQRVTFKYDANHQRYYKRNNQGLETLYFNNIYERNTNSITGDVQHKHFIYAEGRLIVLKTKHVDKNNAIKEKQVHYLHYDVTGSIDLITDGNGDVVERRSVDPWGKPRSVRWREQEANNTLPLFITQRRFSTHDHIEEVDLMHINGRVYDQELGRFMSADPLPIELEQLH